MRTIRITLVLCVVLVLGCLRPNSPSYSPDGKKIAVLLPVKRSIAADFLRNSRANRPNLGEVEREVLLAEFSEMFSQELGIVTRSTNRLVTYAVPSGWAARGMHWIDNRMLIDTVRIPSEPVLNQQWEARWWIFNPEETRPDQRWDKVEDYSGHRGTFVGRYKGQRCLYAEDGLKHTLVFSLDPFRSIEKLPYGVQDAGDGWMIRKLTGLVETWWDNKEGRRAARALKSQADLPARRRVGAMSVPGDVGTFKDSLSAIVLLKGEKEIVQIPVEEIIKVCVDYPNTVMGAKVSDDEKQVVIAFNTIRALTTSYKYELTFGVYDVGTGKLAWQGNSNARFGMPVFSDGTIYALEAKGRNPLTGQTVPPFDLPPARVGSPRITNEIVMVRHTREGPKMIVQLPLERDEKAERYSPSPDGKQFVVQVTGKRPRLLLVPVRDQVDQKEIVAIRLPVGG